MGASLATPPDLLVKNTSSCPSPCCDSDHCYCCDADSCYCCVVFQKLPESINNHDRKKSVNNIMRMSKMHRKEKEMSDIGSAAIIQQQTMNEIVLSAEVKREIINDNVIAVNIQREIMDEIVIVSETKKDE